MPSGSSPRVRGKLLRVVEYRVWFRIIPARAGQTILQHEIAGLKTDHPRACGANFELATSADANAGSSPRVRGKLLHLVAQLVDLRIIPARAGQTRRRRTAPRPRPDHPRACGANGGIRVRLHHPPGSSPRVRGKRGRGADVGRHPRIIPARAGQTSMCQCVRVAQADHPRACGANTLQPCALPREDGSSPRVRGKLGELGIIVGLGRIIPARAGQTA